MHLDTFTSYLKQVDQTASRLEMTKILSHLLLELETKEIPQATYLLSARLGPVYRDTVFSLAEKQVTKALALASGRSTETITGLLRQTGDLGEVALKILKKHPQAFDLLWLYHNLEDIAQLTGEGSQEGKINRLAKLLTQLNPLSAKYTLRIVLGKSRLGFSERTILDALSWALKKDKSLTPTLLAYYNVVPDIGLLTQKVFSNQNNLRLIPQPQLGIPVLPMLAQRLSGPQEMLKKMGQLAIEPKYDGLRLQLHLQNQQVMAFTRSLNEVSFMFPELSQLAQTISADRAIIDCEAVGIDPQRLQLADFQATMTRRRKHHIKQLTSQTPLQFILFDLLLLNNINLMPKPYLLRRQTLKQIIKPQNTFQMSPQTITQDPQQITDLFEQYTQAGLEGIIAKQTQSAYIPGRLGYRWCKMKSRDGTSGALSDTIDAVIMGFSPGRGKRAGFGVGQFLAGIKDRNKIKSITKVGTGLSDKEFVELNRLLKPLVSAQIPDLYQPVGPTLKPVFWVKPKVVVEIGGDNLTPSPTHGSGLAIRFPRLIRLRYDKSVKQISTLDEVKQIWHSSLSKGGES